MTEQTPIICDACATIATSPGTTVPHQQMQVEGEPAVNADGSFDTSYRCVECNTLWVSHTDRWGCAGGFQLLPNIKSS